MPRPLSPTALAGLLAFACLLPAQDKAPPAAQDPAALLPDSPLKARLRELATARLPEPAKAGAEPKPTDLLRPELSFRPKERWVLLPELAQTLGDDDEQRDALKEVLTQGAEAAREGLAGLADGADHDVGVAAALFLTQLWQFARDKELTEAQQDRLHAQLVGHLATAEVGKMRDAEKQRVWEFCIGYPLILATMLETADDDGKRAAARQVADVVFASLAGLPAAQVEIGDRGFVAKATPAKAPAPAAQPATPAPTPRGAAAGAAIPGVGYAAPAGWKREDKDGNVIFRTTLGDVDDQGKPAPNNSSSHEGIIAVLPVLAAPQGPTALFERLWREQYAAFDLGDTVAHYRSRLQSKLVVLYMGRFFARPGGPDANREPKPWGGLWLVELGGGRYQPFVSVVYPRDPSLGMDMFKESGALKSLAFPLGAFLDSIRPTQGEPPHPSGGYFAPEELRGRWFESSSAFGGNYVNTQTGASAGAAFSAASGHFFLLPDSTYEYQFSYYAVNPQMGNQSGSTKHSGSYTLDGDIVKIQPSKPISYTFTCCAVGVGVRQTPKGPRRMLMTVSANRDGAFLAPSLIANWDSYQGVLTWYIDDPDAK